MKIFGLLISNMAAQHLDCILFRHFLILSVPTCCEIEVTGSGLLDRFLAKVCASSLPDPTMVGDTEEYYFVPPGWLYKQI
jgi:hypothetical protein